MALTGRTALLALAGAVVQVAAPGPLTFVAWLVLVAVLVAVDVWRAGSLKTLAWQRSSTASVRLGGSATTTLTVTNQGDRRVRGLVRDAWPPSAGAVANRWPIDVPPGERRRFTTVLRPSRRGDRLADRVTVRSGGPMGLAARQRSVVVPGRVRALPPFGSRRHLPSRLARLRELDGRTSLHVRGQGTEFDSLREYVVGDDVRSIDWRGTARGQTVVVRTWRPERDRHVLVVLDTSRTSAGRVGDAPRLDAAMDAALLLAALASRAGDRVDLLAADRRVRAAVQRRTGAQLLPALVEAMAPLEPELLEADWSAIVGAIRARTSQRALVVLLTALEAAPVEESLLPVLGPLTAHHQVLVASVADPAVLAMAQGRADADAVYSAAAAERTLAERDRVAALLERLGVEVVDAAPDALPPALADRYLALKAAGRL
ncbi:MAG: DUF58 domain-containing protein [Actinomycetales bacterium]